ncbi:MAG: APC family permease [Acidobacteria bacterium]|nr:APC family permease [Acidobacteriota bacterium]
MSWTSLLLGRRLATREHTERKLGVWTGVPALGLDGLGSSAYGPEAALTILAPLGAMGPRYIVPITAVLLVLLGLLYVSYRQTITAYPTGGGSYTVAKENLGVHAGLLAAAALMIDYVLNVAVGISAGIAALVSAFPRLHPWTLWLCLLALALLTLVNLRGTLESGWAFALPTYLFLASFLALLGLGVARALLAGGHPQPVIPPPHLGAAVAPVTIWLLVRAFASGCTAMTGVEAVSNGVSAFRDPPVKHAHGTLTAIVVSLAALLGGIAWLARGFGIGAMDQTKPDYQSVLSQLAAALVGRNVFYYVAIGSLLAVLTLSANTSFVDFPRLCRLIAADRFLPAPFAVVGRRLVFSVGILFLTTTSGLLLVVFGGITDRLIPLFAVGAFLAFTLSQTGMVMHWWRGGGNEGDGRPAWRHLAINGLGAATTGVALAVIIAAKFIEGAWITLLAIPALILLFKLVRRYYERVDRNLWEPLPLELAENEPPVVVIPTESLNKLTKQALRFGMMLSPEVIAVHLSALETTDEDPETEILKNRWREDVEQPARRTGLPPPQLILLQSPYRKFIDPLFKFLDSVEKKYPSRVIAVIVPELVKSHWWQHLLHNRRARQLRAALLQRGGSRLVVAAVPWHLEDGERARADSSGRPGRVSSTGR